MNLSLFEHEYDVDAFLKIQPEGRRFQMWTNEHCAPIYRLPSFEEYTVRLVAAMADRLACFVDVGAHHGYYSLLVGSLSPVCRILAFEPVPENFACVRKNLDLNGLGQAIAYPLALSDSGGSRDFFVSTASDNGGFVAHPATPTRTTLAVPTDRLDAFRQEIPDGPVLVKIDTEGHEIEVLDGMQEILERVADLCLIVEFNPKLLELAGHAPEDLLDRLDRSGFEIYLLDETEGLYFRLPAQCPWDDFVPAGGASNLLCLRKHVALNLLFFSHSSGLNGAERSLLEQVEHVRARGAMATVVVPAPGPLVDRLKQAGAAVLVRDFSWWCDFRQLPAEEQSWRMQRSFRLLIDSVALLEKVNPDVILTQTSVLPWGALAAGLMSRPHVWCVTEFGELAGIHYFVPFPAVLDFIDQTSNFVLTNSRALQHALFDGLRSERIETVYRCIQVPVVTSVQVPSADGQARPTRTLRLAIFGVVTPIKGQLDAIKALAELVYKHHQDVELWIVGSTGSIEYHDRLLELITQENLALRVHVVEHQEDIFPIMHDADIVLSCCAMEAFGRSTLEAMLCGKPVIGANRGGTPELIQDGQTGLLYEPGDYAGLAEKIHFLCLHPEKREQFGRNGRQYALQTFTVETTYERVLQIARGQRDQPNPSPISAMRLILQSSNNSLGSLPASSLETENEIKLLTAVTLAQERQLAEIYGSKAWRFIRLYWKLRGRWAEFIHLK